MWYYRIGRECSKYFDSIQGAIKELEEMPPIWAKLASLHRVADKNQSALSISVHVRYIDGKTVVKPNLSLFRRENNEELLS